MLFLKGTGLERERKADSIEAQQLHSQNDGRKVHGEGVLHVARADRAAGVWSPDGGQHAVIVTDIEAEVVDAFELHSAVITADEIPITGAQACKVGAWKMQSHRLFCSQTCQTRECWTNR